MANLYPLSPVFPLRFVLVCAGIIAAFILVAVILVRCVRRTESHYAITEWTPSYEKAFVMRPEDRQIFDGMVARYNRSDPQEQT